MVHFDTLQYVKKLESAGVPVKQAEMMAEVQKESLAECLDTTLATKADISRLESATKADISKLESAIHKIELTMEGVKTEMKLSRWMLGVVFATAIAQLLEKFF